MQHKKSREEVLGMAYLNRKDIQTEAEREKQNDQN